MQIDQYLQKHQPIVYRTFVNALTNKKLSHAYLLSGSSGMPLEESAIFFAKSILCDNPNPLACGNCITCKRIDDNTYPDLLIFGDSNFKTKKDSDKDKPGKIERIKKGDVEKVIKTFSNTPLEKKGIMIYVLNLVETMTPNAVNALLKFLEEPGLNIYAFLTTENETKLLPTIISRAQTLRFNEVDRQEIINEAVNDGVFAEDAEILSGFYNDAGNIERIAKSNEYATVKEALNTQLESLLEGPDNAIYTSQKFVVPKVGTQTSVRLYIKMLIEIFKELLKLSVNESITLKSYDKILHELLNHVAHIDKSLVTLMTSLRNIEYNVNLGLLLDHIIYQITTEGK